MSDNIIESSKVYTIKSTNKISNMVKLALYTGDGN